MAIKRISPNAVAAKADLQDSRNVCWLDTHTSACAFRRLATQFFAIGKELGWRGPASDLAKLGQQSAEALHTLHDSRCNEIRDEIEAAQHHG